MGLGHNGETCKVAVRNTLKPGEKLTFRKLFKRVREKGAWTDDTIHRHLMGLIVNLLPAREHWSQFENPFLLLHEDGTYELFNPKIHKKIKKGGRIKIVYPKQKKLTEKLKVIKGTLGHKLFIQPILPPKYENDIFFIRKIENHQITLTKDSTRIRNHIPVFAINEICGSGTEYTMYLYKPGKIIINEIGGKEKNWKYSDP